MSAAPSSEPRLRVVIVGCGRIAGGYNESDRDVGVFTHALAYRRHGGFDIVACVDPDEAARRAFMAKWGVPAGFADLDECRRAGVDFDVASVCAPTAAHGPLLEALLGTDARAVFCEKPVTDSAVASRRLVAAYRACGKALAVNYVRRWEPSMAELKREIDAGEWGEVRAVVGWYARGILNNGSHLVDLVQYLLGPLDFVAASGRREDGVDGDPTVSALLRLGAEIPVHLVGGDGRDFAHFELQIVASRGAVAIEESGYAIRRRRAADSPRFPGMRAAERGEWRDTACDDALLFAVDNLHRAVTRGDPLASDGMTALAALELCERIRAAVQPHSTQGAA